MNPKREQHAGTVLVVDDVPDTLRMLCDALMQEGYTVLVARDGEQALERLAAIQPDATDPTRHWRALARPLPAMS